MASLGMKGPFSLTKKGIDGAVTEKKAGNYALGRTDDKGTFFVSYVGRSDTDLNGRLHDWEGKYDQYKYSYADGPNPAFQKECRNFHDFGGTEKLDNKVHPDRPDGTDWKCPGCEHFG